MLVRRTNPARLVALGLFTAIVSACGGGGDAGTEPNDPVASVAIAPNSARLTSIGETAQLSATVRTQAGASANAPVTWQSSAPQIASVDANGMVRAVANGSAQITASAGSVSGTADVTVQQVASRVSLTPGRDSIFTGATLQLTATASDGSNAAITSPRAMWTSSDTSIAIVSNSGLVTGRNRGEARITVRVDSVSASMDIVIRLTSILASRDTVITGPLQVDRFEVAAGRTITLAGDLTLRAEGAVVINGTIRGDCRGVDIVSRQTVTVRGTLDNRCGISTAPGKALRIVSGAEYTLESATVYSSGSITITNDTSITVDASSLGVARRVALRTRRLAAADCRLNGALGSGLTRPSGASGTPEGGDATSGTDMIFLCQGDLIVQGLTAKADHGGDGGEGTSTTAGVPARGGDAGNGGSIYFASATNVIFDGAQLTAGDAGKGGNASSAPNTPGLAVAFASDGGSSGQIFVRAPQIVFQGNLSRFELGRAGDGGEALAVALPGADATPAQAAQQGANAQATSGRGGSDAPVRYDVIGSMLDGQVQNAGRLTIRPPIGGDGGNAEISPGNGGNSNVLIVPNGANGGAGSLRVGGGGDVRLFDNRGSGVPIGTPGGTGSGVIRQGNGGFGIPDCVPPVFHIGGDGGSGSVVDIHPIRAGEDALGRPSLLVGNIRVIDALNGRNGRDGVPPGSGGLAGRLQQIGFPSFLPDVDVGVSRRPGTTGVRCPPTTSTNPICDVQQTPQANFIRQVSQDVFAGNPFGFCANATSNLSTGPVVHSVPTNDPKARMLNHTSFNIIGGATYPVAAGGASTINTESSGTYQITADGVDALNTKYPCGQHANGRTHCVLPTPLAAGPYVIVFGIMNGIVPQADPANLYQYAFVFDRDNSPANNYVPPPQFANDFFKGTDLWYQAQYNPRSAGFSFGATRVVNNSFQTFSTGARLILNGATWFLIVPASEFSVPDPMVRFTAFRHTGNFGLTGDWDGDLQRPVAEPLLKLPIQPTSSPTPRIKSPTGQER